MQLHTKFSDLNVQFLCMYLEIFVYRFFGCLKEGEGGALVFHYHLGCIYYTYMWLLSY